MERDEAVKILADCRYQLAQITGMEHGLTEKRAPSIAVLDESLAVAMMRFEAVVSQAPDRRWLDDIGEQIGMNIEVTARSVLAFQLNMYWTVWDKMGFPRKRQRH